MPDPIDTRTPAQHATEPVHSTRGDEALNAAEPARKPRSFGGTLRVEIIKPAEASWDVVGPRLRALRGTVGAALNETMRAIYPDAMGFVEAWRRGDKDEARASLARARSSAEPTLRAAWTKALVARQEFAARLERKGQRTDSDPLAFAPVVESQCAETTDAIMARFSGQPLRDMIASRASVPSFKTGAAFMLRSRRCKATGEPREARLSVPLWSGKTTPLVVAPCGASAEATWRRLVSGEWKMGRVSISYDDRKGKWYAGISWTHDLVAPRGDGQHAVVHLGVNVFAQALADDGATFRVDGADITVTRRRFAHRAASIGRAIETLGPGGRGHGSKRRLRPLTDLGDKLNRYSETKNRQVAAALVAWCKAHDIGTIHRTDLSGARDAFETRTRGDAHEEVKRLIHSWPFYELGCAIDREAAEHGVAVVVDGPAKLSVRCPCCLAESADFVKQRDGRPEFLLHHGRQFSRHEKRTWFECGACGFEGDGDLVACGNMMIEAGRENPLKRAQWMARKEAKANTETMGGDHAAE